MLVTVFVTVGVVVNVIPKDGTSRVAVEVRVLVIVVVSLIGRDVMIEVAEIFDIMVVVIWVGTVYPRISVHHTVNLF